MKLHTCLLPLLFAAPALWAFPAAPDFSLYGVVRNEAGRPLNTGEGIVIVSSTAGEVTRSPVDAARGRGINYTVHLPMDAGTSSTLYQPTALRPTLPFTMKVEIRGVRYVPIQMSNRTWGAGKPGERMRLDLTLGVDSDGDGIPDSWENALIDGDPDGLLRNLADVRPGDDLDKDGLTNLQEYLLGTYALDRLDALTLDIAEVKDGVARLRFAAVSGRTYYIKSSADLLTWAEEPFATTTVAAAETQTSLRAADTEIVDIYVPVNGRAKLNFRLYAD